MVAAAPNINSLRVHRNNGSVPTLPHTKGLPIGSRKTLRIDTQKAVDIKARDLVGDDILVIGEDEYEAVLSVTEQANGLLVDAVVCAKNGRPARPSERRKHVWRAGEQVAVLRPGDTAPYYRYACMCHRCREARGHLPAPKEPKVVVPIGPRVAARVAREMNAARKHHGGGGEKPRTVKHVKGIPIGSRDCITVPYKRYKCICSECRIARGHAAALKA